MVGDGGHWRRGDAIKRMRGLELDEVRVVIVGRRGVGQVEVEFSVVDWLGRRRELWVERARGSFGVETVWQRR